MNGLVIKSPWIERILQTPRTWVIRGTRTNARGRVALIKGRAGQVVGTCEILDCIGPMTLDEVRAEADKQQVPVEVLMSAAGMKTFAWALSDVKALAEPIAYNHAGGSAVWVKLTPENVPGRYNELEADAPPMPQMEVTITPIVAELQAQSAPAPQAGTVPCEAETEAA